MADYPAKRTFRGRDQWERQAVREGHPPEFAIHDRTTILYSEVRGRVTGVELRQVDPPAWRFEVNGGWYFANELRAGY